MLRVTAVSADGDVLQVSFDDGHQMVTRRNTGGWGDSGAIEIFSLRHHGREVARYHSPYQRPRNTDFRDGFVLLEDGYDQARVSQYWTTADAHIRGLVDQAGGLAQLGATDPNLYDAFELLSHGHSDMMLVAQGHARVHH